MNYVGILILFAVQMLVVHFLFPRLGGIRTSSQWKDSAIVVIIFAAMNYALRHFFLTITFGLAGLMYYLTFGLLGLILNATILVLISSWFPEKIKVAGFGSAFIGGFLLALTNFLLS